jgi:preprotein translocase subunit SecG
MLTLLMILSIIVAIFLIILVLLQPGKGDMSAAMGGFSSQMGSVFGMQKSANILAVVTKVLAGIILVIILATNKFFISNTGSSEPIKKVITEGQNINMTAPPQMPGKAPAPKK